MGSAERRGTLTHGNHWEVAASKHSQPQGHGWQEFTKRQNRKTKTWVKAWHNHSRKCKDTLRTFTHDTSGPASTGTSMQVTSTCGLKSHKKCQFLQVCIYWSFTGWVPRSLGQAGVCWLFQQQKQHAKWIRFKLKRQLHSTKILLVSERSFHELPVLMFVSCCEAVWAGILHHEIDSPEAGTCQLACFEQLPTLPLRMLLLSQLISIPRRRSSWCGTPVSIWFANEKNLGPTPFECCCEPGQTWEWGEASKIPFKLREDRREDFSRTDCSDCSDSKPTSTITRV